MIVRLSRTARFELVTLLALDLPKTTCVLALTVLVGQQPTALPRAGQALARQRGLVLLRRGGGIVVPDRLAVGATFV